MATKTLARLKTEVSFNRDLSHLVDVMKSIAAQQYHIMDRKKTMLNQYHKALEELFGVYDFRISKHPFVRAANTKRMVVLVTTDFGFLGGLNMKVLSTGLKGNQKGMRYLVVGERGANSMREHGLDYVPLQGINPDDTRYELVKKVAKEIFRAVLKDGFGSVTLAAPFSTSMGTQKIHLLNMIPCPMFFKNRSGPALTAEGQERQVVLESEEHLLIEKMTAAWLESRLVEIFESAKLAEFGARMMHLEDSYQTLTKIDKQLRLDYFKARREKIDQSLRETCTAQLISNQGS